MASRGEVPVYNPGQLANRVVGTPGLDQSAGRAEMALAAGATQVRNEVAQLGMQNAHMWGNVFRQVGSAIGGMIQQHAAESRAHDQMLANLETDKIGNRAELASQAKLASMQSDPKYLNDPKSLLTDFNKWYDDSQTTLLANQPNDIQQSKLEIRMGRDRLPLTADAQRWVRTQRSDQAHAEAPALIQQAKYEIGNLRGTPQARFDAAGKISATLSKQLATYEEDGLGGAWLTGLRSGAQRDIDKQFYGNLIFVDRPDQPADALRHLSVVDRWLNSPDTKLLTEDRESIQKDLSNVTSYEQRELEYKQASTLSASALEITRKSNELARSPRDMALQNSAGDWADKQMAEYEGQLVQIDKDPDLSDKAKIVLTKGIRAQMTELKTQVLLPARANIKDYDQEQRRLAGEIIREENAERRAHNALVAEQKKVALEELRNNKQSAAEKAATLSLRLGQLDPATHRNMIIQIGAELVAHNQLMVKAGFMTPERGLVLSREVTNLIGKAAEYKEKPGAQGFPSQFEKQTRSEHPMEINERNAGLIQEMNQIKGRIVLQDRMTKLMNYEGLSDGAKTFASGQYGTWLKNNPQATDAQKSQMMTGIQQTARQRYPEVAAPKAVPAPAGKPPKGDFIPPPPPVMSLPKGKLSRAEAMQLYGVEITD